MTAHAIDFRREAGMRVLLVDAIDPSLDGDIDSWYSPIFIEPRS